NAMDHVFVDAATQLQHRACDDFNAPDPEGVGIYQVTQKDGRRHSTGAAFLAPVRARANLHVITGAEVHQVIVRDDRAAGVQLATA
ncbi:GMC family oxidoreductase, partial [bacterium LRH843]|nr:GMC family oxidoreductase [bacterium LRH843]